MGQEPLPNKTLLMRLHAQRNTTIYGEAPPSLGSVSDIATLLAQRSESYLSYGNTLNNLSTEKSSHRDTDTLLLEMVRAKSRENEEAQDKTLDLPRDDVSEEKPEIAWRSYGEWKSSYSRLYSARRLSQPVEDKSRRISFMGQEPLPNKTLLMRLHAQRNTTIYGEAPPSLGSVSDIATLLAQRSESYLSYGNTLNNLSTEKSSHRDTDTLLLEMVRAKSRENEEAQDKTLDLPRDDVSEDQSSEPCVHGLSMRMTDRSISRRSMSRVSRVSTRRDMDIPSILAFTATVAPAPVPLENPDFQKVNSAIDQTVPRFSIRRSICPVCSQKWKDKSSVSNIKYSGLKRNSSADLPTVMAPARLRSAITREYTPRPVLAAVDENKYDGFMRNSSATWQLTRARRFRTPKLQMPSPEEAAPPISTAPMALKDLDSRVNRFLTDEGLPKYFVDAGFTYSP